MYAPDADDGQQHDNDVELVPECPYALTAQAVIAQDSDYIVSNFVWASITVPLPSTGPPINRFNQPKLSARGPPYSA